MEASFASDSSADPVPGPSDATDSRKRTHAKLNAPDAPPVPDIIKQMSKPDIARVDVSSLMSRVQAFLPAMAQANVELERRMKENPTEDFNIETISTGQESHIELDLYPGAMDGDGGEQPSRDIERDGLILPNSETPRAGSDPKLRPGIVELP